MIETIERVESGPRMSRAVAYAGVVYLAGHVAEDTSADVTGQTRQILSKIDGVLARAGTDKTKILSATIWLADIASYDAMNAVWDAWVAPENAPARACIESRLAGPAYLVEIAIVAAR